MSTARERLIELSGLAGEHSAREHFLAIEKGQGVDRIVFATRTSVLLYETGVVVAQRNYPSALRGIDAPSVDVSESTDERCAFVFTNTPDISITTGDHVLYVLLVDQQTVAVEDFGDDSFVLGDAAQHVVELKTVEQVVQ